MRGIIPFWRRFNTTVLMVFASAGASAAPTITRAPADVSVVSGQNATFSVTATGTGALSYQWRCSGIPLAGATSDSFVIGAARRANEGMYDVVVTDSTGSIASDVAVLTVAPATYPTLVMRDPASDLKLRENLDEVLAAATPLPDGGFLVGGDIVAVDGQFRTLVARFTDAGALDSDFSPQFEGLFVHAIVVQPDGKIVVAGEFERVDGYQRHCIVRLNSDGAVDRSFVPEVIGTTTLKRVLLQPDGKILIIGSNAFGLQRLNADGSRDVSWQPTIAQVDAIALQTDGKVWASLDSTIVSVVRLNSDGTRDSSIAPITVEGYATEGMAIDKAGRVLVGGDFTFDHGATRVSMLRLTADGQRDLTFATSPRYSPSLISVQPNGDTFIGGNLIDVNFQPRLGLAKLDANGVLTDFTQTPTSIDPVSTLGFFPNGDLLVAGAGPTGKMSAARCTASGSLKWRLSSQFESHGYAGAFVPLPNGQFVVAGHFTKVHATDASGLARLNADGSVDTSYGVAATLQSDTIYAGIALPDGRVVLAGAFQGYDSGNALAMISASGQVNPFFLQEPSVVKQMVTVALTAGGGLVAAGPVYSPAFDYPVYKYTLDGKVDPGFQTVHADGTVQLVPQRDGKILLAGGFWTLNGVSARAIGRVNRDGTVDRTFNSPLPFLASIETVALAPDGKIYANVATNTDGTMSLTRFAPNGAIDTSFHRQLTGKLANILVQPNGDVIVRSCEPMAVADGACLARFHADGSLDSTFRAGAVDNVRNDSPISRGMWMRDDGQLTEFLGGGQGGTADGALQGELFQTKASSLPVLATAPASQTVAPGAAATLTASGSADLPVWYQWYRNGVIIAGATNATYRIASLSASTVGSYTVVLSNELGSVSSAPALLTATPYTAGHVANLSVRSSAATGADTLIVGISLGGDGTGGEKPMLFRGVGPTLRSYGVAGALADPVLRLFNADQVKIDENDDWAGGYDFDRVGAFPFAGATPKDAAIYNPHLATGLQSMHVLSKDASSGVVLAEVYDATPGEQFDVLTPRIVNGSARTHVGTGENVLILGFSIVGSTPEKVLIRGVGPTLGAAPFNVPGVLGDPVLQVYNAAHDLVAANDNWEDNAAGADLEAVFAATYAFPLTAGGKDAALVATLQPGTYSAVVRGGGNATGIALVELYEVK